MTDRTHDRWGEPPRDASWDDPREARWEEQPRGEPRERWSGQSWDGPQDPRWDDPSWDDTPAPYPSEDRYQPEERYRNDEPYRTDDRSSTQWDMPRVVDRPSHTGDIPRVPAQPSSGAVAVRGAGRPGSGRKRRRRLRLWQEIPLLILIAFGLAFLVRTFLFQAFYIPSGSMEDTLVRGDRVLVNRVVYSFGDPQRGDVVVFRGPSNWTPEFQPDPNASLFSKVGSGLSDLIGLGKPGEKDFIKRVIGLPGDRVSCCDVKGRVFVNGTPIDEPYVTKNANKDAPKTPGQCGPRQFDEVVVEPGTMFVLGDNRSISQDSRCRGLVPIEDVIGRAGSIAWPPSRWGDLAQPDPFKQVPAPTGAMGPNGSVPAGTAVVLPLLLPVWLTRRRPAWSRRLRA